MLPLVSRALVVGLLIESVLFAQDATTLVSTKSDPANFIVRTFPGGPKASVVLDQCEDLRAELQRSWLRLETADKWEPQCEIVLHPDRTQYLKAVGVGGGSTSGSSLVRSKHGRITARRIDLIVNQDGELTALAHELTHVVLADRQDVVLELLCGCALHAKQRCHALDIDRVILNRPAALALGKGHGDALACSAYCPLPLQTPGKKAHLLRNRH